MQAVGLRTIKPRPGRLQGSEEVGYFLELANKWFVDDRPIYPDRVAVEIV
jgi:hypothetical protein